MKVSVVIPAFNEQKYIKACLEALVNQTTRQKFEVILVDNNCEDETVKIAQKFKDKLSLKIISEKRQGRGAARYRGFLEAQGQIILSTDADAKVYKDWIDTLVGNIGGNQVAVTTSCKLLDLSPLEKSIFNFLQPIFTVLFRLAFGHFWFAGSSFGILKSAYRESGGFNPKLQALEDMDLAKRVAKIGKIKFINKPVIFSGRRFKKGLINGLLEYVKTFTFGYTFKSQSVFLDNPR